MVFCVFLCHQLNRRPQNRPTIFPHILLLRFVLVSQRGRQLFLQKNSNQFVFVMKMQCAPVMWKLKHLMALEKEYNERVQSTRKPCRVPVITAPTVRVIRHK
jgi:hypothetical protein